MSFNAGFERVRARMHSRMCSYRAIFMHAADDKPKARWWQLDYWLPPTGGSLNAAAEVVMRDLSRYCYATKPTLKVSQVTQQSDPIAMAFAEGRRDVYNRLIALCNLTDDDIQRIAQRTNDD